MRPTRNEKKKYNKCLNPIRTELFFGLVGPGGGGGGRIPPPPLNSEHIKAMTTKLNGQIVRPKMFPWRSATSADDVI